MKLANEGYRKGLKIHDFGQKVFTPGLQDGSHGQPSVGAQHICVFTQRGACLHFALFCVCINYEAMVKFLSIFVGDPPMTWGDFISKVFYFLKTVNPRDA